MQFLDRRHERDRLDALLARAPGLGVVYGRRRIGKTRLLVEWCHARDGTYAVADRSAPPLQRRYLAQALSARFPGLADPVWPDWGSLLAAIARAARSASWRGPLVLDELPYLVESSPEIASVLQRWIDHDAREARLVVVLAGSSQRMMQGLALDANEPLYGRASEVLRVGPLAAGHATALPGVSSPREVLAFTTAWGGVPRYWELAASVAAPAPARVDALVLDPAGPLHDEPDRLLLEELPPAEALRPVLDALGAGASRVSEVAARIGRPATSLQHPLARLAELGLVAREVPYGEPARSGKRSLYRIADPFLRLWFRVVAPHRAELAVVRPEGRRALLARHWTALEAATWEELCREAVPLLDGSTALGALGPWGPASRWWRGAEPEWDVVARSLDGRRWLVGEARLGGSAGTRIASRELPEPVRGASDVVRAVFVPVRRGGAPRGVWVVTARELLEAGVRRRP